jgi:hypothetical protein
LSGISPVAADRASALSNPAPGALAAGALVDCDEAAGLLDPQPAAAAIATSAVHELTIRSIATE